MFEIGTATDYQDLLEKLDAFLTTNGSAYGLAYSGTGNGTIAGLGGTGSVTGGASSVAETFEITATSSTNFTVVGSVSGSIGPATVGTNFSHAKIKFRITAGGTAFVSGDKFTLATAPKWTSLRKCRGSVSTASSGATGQLAGENVLDGKIAADGNRYHNATQPFTNELTFAAAETVVEYTILCGAAANAPTAWTLEYHNGSTFVTLDTRSSISWSNGEKKTFAIASPVSATRYRINVSAGSNPIRIDAIQLRRATGGFDAAFSQYIWSAPGNDGASAIYVGLHHFRRVDADYFDWELAAFDGYQAATDFYALPGVHARLYVPLQNASTAYWFVANGRRAIVVAKVGSQYEVAYFGFYDPFFSPNQVPYPIALGGTLAPDPIGASVFWDSTRFRFSNSTNEHRAFTHSDPNTAFTNTTAERHQMQLRRTDGAWRGLASSHADDPTVQPSSTEDLIWPYCGDMQQLDTNLDGSYELIPVVLNNAAPNTYGQLDGVAAVTGQGLTAETLIRKGIVDWLALQNINRTDRDDWFAIALD